MEGRSLKAKTETAHHHFCDILLARKSYKEDCGGNKLHLLMGEEWEIHITWGMTMEKEEELVQLLYLVKDTEHDSHLGFQEVPERY